MTLLSNMKAIPLLPVFLVAMTATAWSLSGSHISTLMKNGVSPETIQLLIREKTIETRTLTIQEIVEMKRSGLEEKTLQALILESAHPAPRKTIVYGEKAGPVLIRTLEDIVFLKQKGVSDDIIRALLQAGSGKATAAEREETFDLLKKMGIVVDLRKNVPND